MADPFFFYRNAKDGDVIPTGGALNPITPEQAAQLGGYWRLEAVKTKPDFPVIIWTVDGHPGALSVQVGGQRPWISTEFPDRWEDFTNRAWGRLRKVPDGELSGALATGRWKDGKNARPMSVDEKLGTAMPTGDNSPPVEESLADQINNLAEILAEVPEPETPEAANALTGQLDRMRRLLQHAETERKAEKEPHLLAGREVDAKWAAIVQPGANAQAAAETRRKAFLRKEQARKDAEAAAENKRRIAEAEAERQRVAAAEAAKLAAQAPDLSEEEVTAIAEERAADAVVVEEVKAERVTAGSKFGRATGLRKVKYGKIVDATLFATTLVEMKHQNIMDLLQQFADRAAKAGMPVKGMEIDTRDE